MGANLFINGTVLSPYAMEELFPGKSSFQKVCETAKKTADVSKIFLLLDSGNSVTAGIAVPEGIEPVIRDRWDCLGVLRVMLEFSEGCEILYYVSGDSPLLDTGLWEKMNRNHHKYFSSYTFADGYPKGLAPEIIKKEILPQLIGIVEKEILRKKEDQPASVNTWGMTAGRDFLFEIIKLDINAFDIETELSPKDQRLLRVVLAADTLRNFIQLKRIIEAGGVDAASVVHILDTQPQLMRTRPAYVAVQITEKCPHACFYCPYPQTVPDLLTNNREISLPDYKMILEKVSGFCDDAVISLSPWGEPSGHSEIAELIRETVKYPLFSLVIETSGVGWDQKALEKIADLPSADGKIDWIVSLDAESEAMYKQIRGEGFHEAHECCSRLLSLFPGRVYPQAVRMNENEAEMESFYRGWKKKAGNVIIQKYDAFCGRLPDRQVTDLSPLKRFPCRHIQRDLTILIDGTVALCREDLEKNYSLGSIFDEQLEKIWARGEERYLSHIKEEYPRPCGSCDEYYTYNF